jgi:capsular exopolysaccharide synthesis family protein
MSDKTAGLVERAAALIAQSGSRRPENRIGAADARPPGSSGLPRAREPGQAGDPAAALPFLEIPYAPQPAKEIKTVTAMRRHWRLILVLTIAGTLVAAVAGQIIPPRYTGTATVIIDPHEAQHRAVGADIAVTLPQEEEETVRRNEVSLIRSRQFVEPVIAQYGLASDPEFNPWLQPPSPLQPAIDRGRRLFLDAVNALGLTQENWGNEAKPTPEQVLDMSVQLFLKRLQTITPEASRIIEIGFSSHDAVRAARVANTVAERFVQDRVNQQVARAQSAIDALRKQIASLNGEIRDAEARSEKLRSQKGLLANSDLTVIAGQIQALNAALANAQVAKLEAEAQPPWSLNRDTHVALATQKVSALQKKVAAAKAEMSRANASVVDVDAFEREIKTKQALMEQLVGRLDKASEQVGSLTPDVRVISAATVPEKPSFPPKLALLGAGFVFAVIGASVLAVLLEHRDRSIRSADQLRQVSTAPILGAMPTLNRIGWLGRSPAAQVLREPKSMFAENLRAVWFQIGQRAQPGAATLAITSALSREGKTSIAVSLARTLALGGRKTVVVDADLRYPGVHRVLGLDQGPGFAELLAGSIELDRALQQDAASGAFCITAGKAVASPADLLQSPNTAEVLASLSARFEAVIVDTPPVLGVHDAAIVARRADMTVMVVRWGATREETFGTAMQRLSDFNIPVAGVILTRVNLRKYARYGAPDQEAYARSMRRYYSS